MFFLSLRQLLFDLGVTIFPLSLLLLRLSPLTLRVTFRANSLQIKTLLQHAIQMKKDLYLGFIECIEASYRARQEDLFEILEKLDLEGKVIRLTCNVFERNRLHAKIERIP